MLDPIPTEVTKHCKAPTDGVSSSDMLGCGIDLLRCWGGFLVQEAFDAGLDFLFGNGPALKEPSSHGDPERSLCAKCGRIWADRKTCGPEQLTSRGEQDLLN